MGCRQSNGWLNRGIQTVVSLVVEATKWDETVFHQQMWWVFSHWKIQQGWQGWLPFHPMITASTLASKFNYASSSNQGFLGLESSSDPLNLIGCWNKFFEYVVSSARDDDRIHQCVWDRLKHAETTNQTMQKVKVMSHACPYHFPQCVVSPSTSFDLCHCLLAMQTICLGCLCNLLYLVGTIGTAGCSTILRHCLWLVKNLPALFPPMFSW